MALDQPSELDMSHGGHTKESSERMPWLEDGVLFTMMAARWVSKRQFECCSLFGQASTEIELAGGINWAGNACARSAAHHSRWTRWVQTNRDEHLSFSRPNILYCKRKGGDQGLIPCLTRARNMLICVACFAVQNRSVLCFTHSFLLLATVRRRGKSMRAADE